MLALAVLAMIIIITIENRQKSTNSDDDDFSISSNTFQWLVSFIVIPATKQKTFWNQIRVWEQLSLQEVLYLLPPTLFFPLRSELLFQGYFSVFRGGSGGVCRNAPTLTIVEISSGDHRCEARLSRCTSSCFQVENTVRNRCDPCEGQWSFSNTHRHMGPEIKSGI